MMLRVRGLARAMVQSQHRRFARVNPNTKRKPRLNLDVKSLDPATRDRVLTTCIFNAKSAELLEESKSGRGRCSRCWLVKKVCICAYVDGSGLVEGALTTPLPPMPHR